MKRWIIALGALATLNGGCTAIVLDPVEPADAGPSTALAIRVGDWTASPPVQVWSSEAGPGRSDPDALALFFATESQQCSQPVLAIERGVSGCEPRKSLSQLILIIPPELDRPGLIDLTDGRIAAHESMWSDTCTGGAAAGLGFGGTLEIVSSDATSVSVKLRGGDSEWGAPAWSPELDGDYTAPRCGSAPPASPPSPALAVLGADLPAPPAGSEPVDPTALYFFLGTATCQDPWSSVTCTHTFKTTLRLPASLQKPGVLSLSDPALAATFSASLDVPSNCGAGDGLTGSFARGTIEILSIDDAGASLRVYGSNDLYESPPGTFNGFSADGLYAASVCP